ncbi:hypothetical protein ABGB19_03165 [Mycobacterium sp. B14F4]|uniref:hypothetical protein n=1 Tax=Mycobacterium sp. B14F4 TaxID=3153565 RepID=UPI00325E0A9C
MGQLIMLGTLFGLIILIFGVVVYFDPEARGGTGDERLREEQTASDERLREEQTASDERLREEQTASDERLREEQTASGERDR